MREINVEKLNESVIRIYGEGDILHNIREYFSFEVPNAQFMRRRRGYRSWDGRIRLFCNRTNTLPLGLTYELSRFCQENDIKINLINAHDFVINDLSEDAEKIINDRSLLHVPRPDQIEAVKYFAKRNRGLILSATSSGKTFIIYMIMRILVDNQHADHIVITFPTTNLVNETYNDFIEYDNNNSTFTTDNVTKMGGRNTPDFSKRVLLTTWQSYANVDNDIIRRTQCLIVDEAHRANAKVQQDISRRSINAKYRIGLTGTMDDWKVAELQLIGAFGEILQLRSARDLIDDGDATEVEIRAWHFNYADETRKKVTTPDESSYILDISGNKVLDTARHGLSSYQRAISVICEHEQRREVIVKNALNDTMNSLVIATNTDGHLKPMFDLACKLNDGSKRIFYLVGDDQDDFEEVMNIIRQYDNCVLFSSYGLLSTGVNNPNLHNLHLASPIKSRRTLVQTIGRMIRLNDNKDLVIVNDYVDNLPKIYSQYHERVDIYDEEGHSFMDYKTIDLEGGINE